MAVRKLGGGGLHDFDEVSPEDLLAHRKVGKECDAESRARRALNGAHGVHRDGVADADASGLEVREDVALRALLALEHPGGVGKFAGGDVGGHQRTAEADHEGEAVLEARKAVEVGIRGASADEADVDQVASDRVLDDVVVLDHEACLDGGHPALHVHQASREHVDAEAPVGADG